MVRWFPARGNCGYGTWELWVRHVETVGTTRGCYLLLLLCVEVVCEPDADVVVAEVVPRGGLLVGGLLATAAVLVVQDVVELQHEARFVLQYLPANGCIPDEDVAVHAADGVASADALGEG